MSGHPHPEAFEHYVLGLLDAGAQGELEAHLGACPACAAALAREARLELALMEVARAPVSLKATRARRLRLGAAAAAVAAAAAAVLLVVGTPPGGEQRPRLVDCSDPRSADACLAGAQYDGLLTIGPGNELVVPRYDASPRGTR